MDLIYAINVFHKRNLREAHKEKNYGMRQAKASPGGGKRVNIPPKPGKFANDGKQRQLSQ